MNETLGILVNDELIKGIKKNDTGHEKLEFYEEAGKRYDLVPCFFRLQDISLGDGTVMAFLKQEGVWKRRRLPLPSVIHNRAIYHSQHNYLECKRLEGKHIALFNFWNRYSKLQIARLLAENEILQPCLPATLPFSKENLSRITEQFSSFLLKPNKGTVGKGITKVERIEKDRWILKYRSGNRLAQTAVWKGKLYKHLQRLTSSAPCLLQETIDLATYGGSPFDIRVSVQKDREGKWGITGMVGKVARSGHFLSNVAQGGKVYPLSELLREYPHLQDGKLQEKISEVSLIVVHDLEKRLPHLADLGFDFGITREGSPFFIEMNGRDQRYSFAKANMTDIWKRTYEKPVAYARHLLDRKKERGG